jgi:beta-glucanase (GH16 family)
MKNLFKALAAILAVFIGAFAVLQQPAPEPVSSPSPLVDAGPREPGPFDDPVMFPPASPFQVQSAFNTRRVWTGNGLMGSDWYRGDRVPDVANGEQQYYLSANDALSSGILTITSQIQASHTYSYTSGYLFWDSFSYQYGKLRVRAKFPGGQGTWPTIWLLATGCQTDFHTDPDTGGCISVIEIDIAEPFGSDPANLNQQIHNVSTGNHPRCQATWDTSWHTYGFDWSSGDASFLVDEVQTCHITGSDVPATPMFLILNVALGGNGGGTINNGDLPRTMQVSGVTLVQ